jgi:hypothetical protein
MIPGGALVPIGLLIHGWAAHFKTHWIVPNIGAVIFATGLIIGFQCAQAYVVDAYTRYAASASGAAAFVRTLAGFSFPLFAPAMYSSLGLAWGNSLLAFISIGLGIPVPILLWKYGHLLRARSTYCAGWNLSVLFSDDPMRTTVGVHDMLDGYLFAFLSDLINRFGWCFMTSEFN